MRTTLNKIRAHSPCRDGWEKLLRGLDKTQPDDEPLWIDQILDINGLDDALWCLRAVDGCDREIRLYAVWCARRVQHLMADPRSIAALNVAERFARGEASGEELAAAEAAAASAWASTSRGGAAWASAVASAARSTAEWAVAYAARASAASAVAWAASEARWAAEAVAAEEAAWSARDTERDAQAEELRRVCREMREAGR
jgi:hypothetical protein